MERLYSLYCIFQQGIMHSFLLLIVRNFCGFHNRRKINIIMSAYILDFCKKVVVQSFNNIPHAVYDPIPLHYSTFHYKILSTFYTQKT